MIDQDGNVRCDRCNHYIQIGEHPFCPHGQSRTTPFRDEIPGGLVCENYGPQPVTFYSHSERRAYMRAHGLLEKEKFSPMPGTDKDPQGIPNPKGYMDAQTLENARALICRNGQSSREWDGEEAGVLRPQPTRELSVEEAIEVQHASK